MSKKTNKTIQQKIQDYYNSYPDGYFKKKQTIYISLEQLNKIEKIFGKSA